MLKGGIDCVHFKRGEKLSDEAAWRCCPHNVGVYHADYVQMRASVFGY